MTGRKVGSQSKFQNTYTSFAGCDIVAVITPRNGKPQVLGELQTLSYSVYRSTAPVHALGSPAAKGIVRGARTIAGSLIFTVFDRHVLYDIMREIHDDKLVIVAENGVPTQNRIMNKPLKSDEIPGFDITVNFLNEYGQSSQLTLFGVHLISEGQTMSVEDMITENTMEFIALDIDLMKPDSVEEHSSYDIYM